MVKNVHLHTLVDILIVAAFRNCYDSWLGHRCCTLFNSDYSLCGFQKNCLNLKGWMKMWEWLSQQTLDSDFDWSDYTDDEGSFHDDVWNED